jgi:hypothetical protein
VKATAKQILSAYDAFLATLDDPDKRKRLSGLKPEDSYADAVFEDLRARSHDFQSGLIDMFYKENEQLRELMLKYGVF